MTLDCRRKRGGRQAPKPDKRRPASAPINDTAMAAA
jgi:hypothetical protein